MKKDPAQEEQWLRQLNLVYVALMGLGVVMVQPFLTAASLDLSAKICVVAFSVAIPLLAALVMINQQEVFRRRLSSSRLVAVARPVAQMCALVGVVAGFWHIFWLAGVGLLVAALVGVGVHSAGFVSLLEGDMTAPPQDVEDPGDSDS